MPVIEYKAFEQYLKKHEEKSFAPVFLIYGEEFLYKSVFEKLLQTMLPGSKKTLNYEPIDGTSGSVFEIIEQINTYSFLSGMKVVSFTDSQIFYSKQDGGKHLEKAKDAFEKEDLKKAARHLTSLLSLLNLSFDDIKKETRKKTLKDYQDKLDDDAWLDTTISYCEDQGIEISGQKDHMDILQAAVEKGFPKGNHLIITTDLADKRRRLYKAINKAGVIIDCSVPKSSRTADKKAQKELLFKNMGAILTKTNKKLDRGTFEVMYEMTGFDLRTFSGNMEKLASYVGDRGTITVDDVRAVLKRTKQDPIYEITNAVTDKALENALFYLNSLLLELHPLQVLTAIINQTRKLLIIKDFSESTYGSTWQKGMGYQSFTSSTLPAIQSYDKEILKKIHDWEDVLTDETKTSSDKQKKKGPATDLLLAKNPGNPYPIYKMFEKSENFTREQLIEAFEILSKADLRMKRSGGSPKMILEEVIIKICKSNPARQHRKNLN